MNHDDSKKQNPEAEQATQPSEPKKIMLGKRVLRHFHLKSGVKTGLGEVADTGSTRCHRATA